MSDELERVTRERDRLWDAVHEFVEIESKHPLDWNRGETFDAFSRLRLFVSDEYGTLLK